MNKPDDFTQTVYDNLNLKITLYVRVFDNSMLSKSGLYLEIFVWGEGEIRAVDWGGEVVYMHAITEVHVHKGEA